MPSDDGKISCVFSCWRLTGNYRQLWNIYFPSLALFQKLYFSSKDTFFPQWVLEACPFIIQKIVSHTSHFLYSKTKEACEGQEGNFYLKEIIFLSFLLWVTVKCWHLWRELRSHFFPSPVPLSASPSTEDDHRRGWNLWHIFSLLHKQNFSQFFPLTFQPPITASSRGILFWFFTDLCHRV